ncbi:hypothetical protein BDN72DRAFT_963325 [Pluteus cervinus]|uniref:Uncharacterized protein n=1 Tax=Pluteus cervinus TaxID=181527 RepID=A0ACD3AF85_9AGAR|nr:hypothetical protein BDN72DRAFT_963325 [Pluteus cervinus]
MHQLSVVEPQRRNVANLASTISYPDLPLELELLIFQQAAEGQQSFILTLMRVSRNVKARVEPILYRTIIRSRVAYPDLPRGYDPPLERLSTYCHLVQNLLIASDDVGYELICAHLTTCKNLVNVVIWCEDLPQEISILPLLDDLHITRLSCVLSVLYLPGRPFEFSSPLFKRLVHLDIRDDGLTWDELKGLKDLSNLTHLAILPPYRLGVVDSIAENCPQLRVLVLKERYWWYDDYRVVHISLSYGCYISDWLAQCEGRSCSWVVAENTIKERLRGPGPLT